MNKAEKLSNLIYDIHQTIGNRITGSREEKLTAKYIKSILSQFSDEVILDSFKCNSRSKQYEINFFSIMYCFALLGYIIYPPSSIATILLVIVYLILLIFYDFRLIDYFFSDDKSQNIIARIKPKGEIKEKIIFTAHTDSAYVNNIYDHKLRSYSMYFDQVFLTCFSLLLLISLFKVFDIFSFLVDYLYLLPFFSLGIILYLQNKSVNYEKSFGANNSLSGLSITIGLAKHFFYNKMEHTEIYICNFGAKEANFKGSKVFLKKYYQEIKNARIINLESISGGPLYISEKESMTNHSSELVNDILSLADNISISAYKSKNNLKTDARIFSYEKIRAITILSLDKNGIPLRYCLKEDLPIYILEEDLQNTYKICIELVKLIDERTKQK